MLFKDSTSGWNALHFLCIYYFEPDFSDIVNFLCSKGIDVDEVTSEDHDVFYLRYRRYDFKISSSKDIETLINQGLDMNAIAKRNTLVNKSNYMLFLLSRIIAYNSDFLDIFRLLYKEGFFESIDMMEHEWHLLFCFCFSYRGSGLLDIMSLITGELHRKYHHFWDEPKLEVFIERVF